MRCDYCYKRCCHFGGLRDAIAFIDDILGTTNSGSSTTATIMTGFEEVEFDESGGKDTTGFDDFRRAPQLQQTYGPILPESEAEVHWITAFALCSRSSSDSNHNEGTTPPIN